MPQFSVSALVSKHSLALASHSPPSPPGLPPSLLLINPITSFLYPTKLPAELQTLIAMRCLWQLDCLVEDAVLFRHLCNLD